MQLTISICGLVLIAFLAILLSSAGRGRASQKSGVEVDDSEYEVLCILSMLAVIGHEARVEFSSGKPRWLSLGMLIGIECVSAMGCSSAHHAQVQPSQPIAEESLSAATAPTDWRKLDADAFSISAPLGWKFHQLRGIDSYVGEFVGDGMMLRFDFGRYSNPLKEEKKPAYVVVHKSIGGLRAKIVSPETPGHGVTGVYFPRTFGSNKLCLFGQDLTSTQQELALKIFETIQIGRTVPPIFPPPAKNMQ